MEITSNLVGETVHENGKEKTERLPLEDELDKQADAILKAKEAKDLIPNGYLRLFARHIVADGSFDTSSNELNSPKDSRYQRILNIFEAYAKREEEIEFKNAAKEFVNLKRDIDEEVETKRYAENILRPGNFLAHGGYVGEFESVVKDGGLMSSGARVKKGLVEREKIPRWARVADPNFPESNAIFFYPWKDGHAGTYESNEYDARGSTDFCYLYSAESVMENSRMVRIKPHYKNDIAVTTSKKALATGDLVEADDDETLLPLKDAYLVIPDDQKEKIDELLITAGYSKEWREQHIFAVNIERKIAKYALMRDRPENNMATVLQSRKEEINEWLNKVYVPPKVRILLKRLDNKKPGHYGGPGDSYAPTIKDSGAAQNDEQLS